VRVVLAVTLVYFVAYGPLEPALLGVATVPVVGRLRPGRALAGNALVWGVALLPLLVVTRLAPAMLALAVGG
jgi:hypothetical protein